MSVTYEAGTCCCTDRPPVQTDCCPAPIPGLLYVRLLAGPNFGTGTQAGTGTGTSVGGECLDGHMMEITYNTSNFRWEGSSEVPNCGYFNPTETETVTHVPCRVGVTFSCNGGFWSGTVSVGAPGYPGGPGSFGPTEEYICEPFFFQDQGIQAVSKAVCCSGAAITVQISSEPFTEDDGVNAVDIKTIWCDPVYTNGRWTDELSGCTECESVLGGRLYHLFPVGGGVWESAEYTVCGETMKWVLTEVGTSYGLEFTGTGGTASWVNQGNGYSPRRIFFAALDDSGFTIACAPPLQVIVYDGAVGGDTIRHPTFTISLTDGTCTECDDTLNGPSGNFTLHEAGSASWLSLRTFPICGLAGARWHLYHSGGTWNLRIISSPTIMATGWTNNSTPADWDGSTSMTLTGAIAHTFCTTWPASVVINAG